MKKLLRTPGAMIPATIGSKLIVLVALLLAPDVLRAEETDEAHEAESAHWRLTVAADKVEQALDVLADVEGVVSTSAPDAAKGEIEVELKGITGEDIRRRLVQQDVLVLDMESVHPWFIPASTFWAIISFLIVLWVIWKKLLPPITDAIDRRAREIRDSLAAAEKAQAEAKQMIERHQADLETARHEARAIIDEGKRDAESVKERIVQSARQEAEEVSARAQREIELAKQAALEDLHLQSVQLSFDLASRLIEKNLDPKEHQDLVDERVRSFREGT